MKITYYNFFAEFGRKFLYMGLLISMISQAQTTLATYDFTDNLNPNAGAIGAPSLKYYNSSGMQTVPSYTNGTNGSRVLNTTDEGAYVELTIDTSGYGGINVSWYGEVNYGFLNQGDWDLYANTGSGYGTSLLTMDLFNFIVFFSDARTENFTLDSAADNNSTVKIKIKCDNINSNIRLDKLVITSRSPKINVFGYNTTNVLTQIPVNSPAATIYGTDFGMVITSSITPTGYSDRVFRIQNNGAAVLNISAINFTGLNAADFSIFGALPTTVNSLGGTKDFTVRFNPSSDGKSSALLNIFSNADPSPYSYYLEGRGASCRSEDLPFKNNTMESGIQSLSSIADGTSTFNKVSGYSRNSTASNSNNLGGGGTRLYGPGGDNANYNLFTSSNSSWYIRGETSTVNFGPVDVTNEKGVSISFNLAAFSSSSGTTFNNNDVVKLEVLDPITNSWSTEVEIRGNNNGTAKNSRFSFNSGSYLEGTYDGNNLPIGGPVKNSAVKLKLLSSSNFTNLAFRITAASNTTAKVWLIDDVIVSTANAIFKTYTGTGLTGWKNSANNDTPAPIIEEKAIINADFTGDLTACECEVLPTKSVVINPGNVVRLENKLNNNGSFIIESDGNLIQNDNTAINSGDIISKRDIKISTLRNQYNYLGTPVAFQTGESYKTIFPGSTTTVLYHNQATNTFLNSSGANIPGRGSAVKEPVVSITIPFTALATTAQYKGIPQNGEILLGVINSNTAVATFGYNLVSNPYASNIDLRKLYDINGGKTDSTKVFSPNIGATFYFWDNNGNTQFEQQGSGYNGQSYALFNVLTGSNGTGTIAASGTKMPTKIVKVGQGFMTKSLIANYNFKFNNSIRTNDTSPTDFLGKSASTVQDDRYWLRMTAPSGITSTIAIVHYPGGNNLFGVEDSRSMGGSDIIYSMAEDEKVSINGRSSLVNTDIIPLGSKHFVNGNYVIAIDTAEGIFANGQNIYLKDKQTGIITNLSQGTYTFSAIAGESTGRFEISYQPETVLATDSKVKETFVVYRNGNEFVAQSSGQNITDLQLFDAGGRLILQRKGSQKELRFPADRLLEGMFVVKVTLKSGEIMTRKIRK
ncbi:choice-of-anchor D domain-containing protein [Kaistella jeonii]|uniref:Choice-of-anchor D domain-containing protein n=1 Tax=Kaistella jeonii TaxID=266749 RepID=A0A0C1D5W8_9FLAO|nr:choice-of-anchor D domain-containing protein [Kaistella jeonii]KIA89135.1 hypothetical protein OA86_08730 [Kaistella jeonii]SFB93544.1 hypothetical protein SAMN05421876_10411 [Kaistella jeonii]VEI97048.1 Uncharacterised protein [Kaistella jeonii]